MRESGGVNRGPPREDVPQNNPRTRNPRMSDERFIYREQRIGDQRIRNKRPARTGATMIIGIPIYEKGRPARRHRRVEIFRACSRTHRSSDRDRSDRRECPARCARAPASASSRRSASTTFPWWTSSGSRWRPVGPEGPDVRPEADVPRLPDHAKRQCKLGDLGLRRRIAAGKAGLLAATSHDALGLHPLSEAVLPP